MHYLLAHKKTIFIIAACIGLGLLSWQLLDARQVTMADIDTKTLLLFGAAAIIVQMAGHWLRAVKHRYLLEQIRPIRTIEVFKGQMIGLLFNTIFPFRLGELVRAHYIGKGVSISRSAVFATIMFERLLDTIILALIALFILATTLEFIPSLVYAVITLSLIASILGTLLYAARAQQTWLLRSVYRFSRLFNIRIRNRIRMVSWSAIYCLKNVIASARMPRYLALTVVMWVCYIASTYILIMGITHAIPFTRQLLSAVAAYFGVSIPSGPAYIGTFQDVFSEISALPAAILETIHLPFILWALLIVPTTVLGLCFLVLRQRLYHGKARDTLGVLKNKLYRDADITKEFSHFLDAYFKGDQINRILTSQELANNFHVLKTFKGGSNALTLLAWQDDRMVVKKITLKQYESKLRDQYLWLKERGHLRQIAKALQEHRDADHYSLDIEYQDSYIPFFDFIHSSSVKESKQILRAVCTFVDKHIYLPQKEVKNPRRLLNDYIHTKAVGKITDAANANLPIAHLLTYDTLVVNGREIKNFSGIVETITNHKQAMADLTDIVDCPIQGDLTVDNIIVNPANGKFIILDPNNENAISDPVVDYGKLMQSVHSGYEFIFSLSRCNVTDNQVNFEERRSVQYDRLYRDLSRHLQENLTPGRYRAILFHEAIHYCRMLTYRVAINPDTAAAFYCIAVRLLNDFMEQYDHDETKA
jgi:uncharacterized membrane protein YbhN (UPF0104 family)